MGSKQPIPAPKSKKPPYKLTESKSYKGGVNTPPKSDRPNTSIYQGPLKHGSLNETTNLIWTGNTRMNQITKQIWLGDINDAHASKELLDAGITSVLSLYDDELSIEKHHSITYHHILLKDGKEAAKEYVKFEKAVDLLKYIVLLQGEIVLVHCAAGISRSPTIVATFIANTVNKSLKESIDFVHEARDQIFPHDTLIKLGEDYLKLRTFR